MPLLFARRALVYFCLGLFLGGPAVAVAQTNAYVAYGLQFPIIGSLLGDQTHPDVAINENGGYVVWQDNITDPAGIGISAMQLTNVNNTISGTGTIFPVNTTTTNDQVNPRVALLNNGGAVFAWQGGPDNFQHIYARFLNSANGWTTPTNVLVSTDTNTFQSSPAIATLPNGDVVVVFSSFDQASTNSLFDIYGQLFSPTGTAIGTNFLINLTTAYNQRSPAVAALTNGFVVAWISEQQQAQEQNNGSNNVAYTIYPASTLPSADVYERLFTVSGATITPSSGEIQVDEEPYPCAGPGIATASDGSYMVTWCANDVTNALDTGWDIYARSFTNSTGGPVIDVNSYTAGDQYNPQISAIGGDYMIAWTSLGQDGDREGVYGQMVHENGDLVNGEFLVNTTTLGQQMQPAVASDGDKEFLTVWTSFTFGPSSFDLFSQAYVNAGAALEPMPAPYVWAPFVLDTNNNYVPELAVSWAPVTNLTVSSYLVFVDGANTNMAAVTNNNWVMTPANGLQANTTHTFALEYVTSQGFVSPPSPSASGKTWLGFYEGTPPYVVPFEWLQMYYGGEGNWPSVDSPVVRGGPTVWQIFNTGGNPTNSATWLRSTLKMSSNGFYLIWNSVPGRTYQAQVTTDFKTWTNFGSPQFATGANDSIFVGSGGGAYYRVQLLQP
ncbi:MAG TPA: hypothetical protein VMF08_23940 [Candidatus Sulfotelmatobacter sp.]|nr:hypothetical protein [Candidatus Sulfotelmatobacter sp.]